MVSQAKAQGELGQQQVRQMTELVGQMRTAQQEAAKFGEQVGDALAKGYSSFANETKQSIQQITRDHQLVMNDAVKVVKDNISELDETLNKIVQVARTRA
jgi:phage shock protein A